MLGAPMDPNLLAPGQAGGGRFRGGNPFADPRVPATAVTAQLLNSWKAELENVLARAGITPDAAIDTQLADAIALLTELGIGPQASIGSPASLVGAGPYAVSGSRLGIQLFDMPGLWICGNARGRPFQGTLYGGDGGMPRQPLVDGTVSAGNNEIALRDLLGNVAPAVGQQFTIGGHPTVYTVTVVGTFDFDTRTLDSLTFSPNLADNADDGDALAFRILVDNAGGYSAGATTMHVDGLIDEAPGEGCTFLVAGSATVHTVTNRTQRTSPSDCDITFTPALTAAAADNALLTFTGSEEDNTQEPNDYATGRFPGQAWPYFACDAQTAHFNPGTEATGNGAFPACYRQGGFNNYTKGFFLPRRVFAGTPTLELSLFGDYSCNEANTLLECILAPNLDLSQPMDLTGWAFAFQSDVLDTGTHGTGTFPVRIDLRIQGGSRTQTGNLYTMQATCDFWIGQKTSVPGGPGCNPPVVRSHRGPINKSVSASVLNFRRTDLQMPLLWKFEKGTLAGYPGRVGAACGALHNGTNLLRMTHYSGRLWLGQH